MRGVYFLSKGLVGYLTFAFLTEVIGWSSGNFNVFFVLFECLVLGESRKFLVSGLKVSRFQVRY